MQAGWRCWRRRASCSRVQVVDVSALPRPVGPQGYDASLVKLINLAELRNTLKLTGPLSADELSVPDNALKPDARQLEKARRLICFCLGAMTDLLDWAERITQGDSCYKDFIEQMRQLVRQGELAFLRRFAKNRCNPIRAEY